MNSPLMQEFGSFTRLASHYFIPSLLPGAILILNPTQTATTQPPDHQTTIDSALSRRQTNNLPGKNNTFTITPQKINIDIIIRMPAPEEAINLALQGSDDWLHTYFLFPLRFLVPFNSRSNTNCNDTTYRPSSDSNRPRKFLPPEDKQIHLHNTVVLGQQLQKEIKKT